MGPEVKDSPLLLCHNFNNFNEKDLCTMFFGALISSHEVMQLKSFESRMTYVIPVNYKIIQPYLSLHIFVKFMVKRTFCTVSLLEYLNN